MNSGTASSAKFCVSVTVSWIGMVDGSSGCCRKNSAPEMPIAKATGMPMQQQHREGDEDDQHRHSGASRLSTDVHGAVLGALAAQLGADLQRVVTSSSSAPTGRLMVTQE